MVQKRNRRNQAPESGPRLRIVEASIQLFYKRGYPSVTVHEVMNQARAYKKSFYRYFQTREDLAHEYLSIQRERFLQFLSHLVNTHDNFPTFWRAWMRFLRREIRLGRYFGCPFANLSSQLGLDRPDFRKELRDFSIDWIEVLANGLVKWKMSREIISARLMARQMMMSFEGAIALQGMTGDTGFIDQLEQTYAEPSSRRMMNFRTRDSH